MISLFISGRKGTFTYNGTDYPLKKKHEVRARRLDGSFREEGDVYVQKLFKDMVESTV